MIIMVVGGGGREHAIIKKLKENKNVDKIYALPGNGGIAADAECVAIGACEIDKILSFAKEKAVDFAVIAPDDPLVLGLVDLLEDAGIPCFGPRKNAAIIEGSKVFSKNLMKKYGIPTARYEVFTEMDKALAFIREKACSGITAADVTRQLPGSRRLAEINFRKVVGHTIMAEILNVRFEQVEALLRDKSQQLGAIAGLCGWKTENALRTAFLKRYGKSMRDWRRETVSVRPNQNS